MSSSTIFIEGDCAYLFATRKITSPMAIRIRSDHIKFISHMTGLNKTWKKWNVFLITYLILLMILVMTSLMYLTIFPNKGIVSFKLINNFFIKL